MQARLLTAVTLFYFAMAPQSFAGEQDTPATSGASQYSLHEADGRNILKLSGTPAQAIFDHLMAPGVQRFETDSYQLRTGYGLKCFAYTVLGTYECLEEFTDNGYVFENFEYDESLEPTENDVLIKLTFHGPAVETLYNNMSSDKEVKAETKDPDEVEIAAGSQVTFKQRTGLTCIRTISADGLTSFKCVQLIAPSGLTYGPGTHPLIGSGTHPIQVF